MKKIAFRIFSPVSILIALTILSCPIPLVSKDIVSLSPSDQFIRQLDQHLTSELLQRLPKSRTWVAKILPTMVNHHRLTNWFELDLRFSSLEVKSQKEAIEIVYPYFRAYLDTLNNVQVIRPYLMEFPIPFTSLDFSAQFQNKSKDTKPFPISNVLAVCIHPNYFKIIQLNPDETLQNCAWARHINIYPTPEKYPDEFLALALPHLESLATRDSISLLENTVFSHFCLNTKKEFLFCQNLAHSNDLLLIAFECIDPSPGPHALRMGISTAYAAQEKRISLDEAKTLVMRLRALHMPFYQHNLRFIGSVNDARKEGLEVLSPQINAQRYFSMRLSFWDKYIDRIKPPHIAEVRVYGEKARYYTCDELQRLQLVYEEDLPPYELEIPVPSELLTQLPKGEKS